VLPTTAASYCTASGEAVRGGYDGGAVVRRVTDVSIWGGGQGGAHVDAHAWTRAGEQALWLVEMEGAPQQVVGTRGMAHTDAHVDARRGMCMYFV